MPASSSSVGRRRRLTVLAVAGALLGGLMPMLSGTALAAVTSPSLGTITMTADTAATATSPSWAATGSIVLTEGAAGDIQPDGAITLATTGLFAFRTTGVGAGFTVAAGSTCGLTATVGSITTTSIPIAIGGTPTSGSDRCQLTITGVQVQPTGTAAPQSGTITVSKSGTAINGITNGTSIASLSEQAGAAYSVVLTWTPPATIQGGNAFTTQPSVTVRTATATARLTRHPRTHRRNGRRRASWVARPTP